MTRGAVDVTRIVGNVDEMEVTGTGLQDMTGGSGLYDMTRFGADKTNIGGAGMEITMVPDDVMDITRAGSNNHMLQHVNVTKPEETKDKTLTPEDDEGDDDGMDFTRAVSSKVSSNRTLLGKSVNNDDDGMEFTRAVSTNIRSNRNLTNQADDAEDDGMELTRAVGGNPNKTGAMNCTKAGGGMEMTMVTAQDDENDDGMELTKAVTQSRPAAFNKTFKDDDDGMEFTKAVGSNLLTNKSQVNLNKTSVVSEDIVETTCVTGDNDEVPAVDETEGSDSVFESSSSQPALRRSSQVTSVSQIFFSNF